MLSKSMVKIFRVRNILASLIILFFILSILAKFHPFFSFDLFITREIQLINISILDWVLKFITWLGNPFQATTSLIIVSLALFIYGRRLEALMLTLSTLSAVGLSELLKMLILRPRPDPLLISQFEHFYRSDSFPSGHVMFFIGFYGYLLFLSYLKLKKGMLKKIFVTGFLVLILLVGLSRIYLGSHWSSDVLGAYLIGSVLLYVMIMISGKLKIK